MLTNLPRIIVALDFAEPESALRFTENLDSQKCMVKVGKELFTASGVTLIQALKKRGFSIFLDLKYHDIPNQVANACRVAAELGVELVDVHTLGGRRMMEAASQAIATYSKRPLLVGVTILTSMQDTDLAEIGISYTATEMVSRLALLAKDSGLDGVVCSAQEAPMIKTQCGKNFVTVTPGIRLNDETKDDQRRIMTPSLAVKAGADFLVIGRPITEAKNPIQVLKQIESEISAGA